MSSNVNATDQEFYGSHYNYMEEVKHHAIVLSDIAVKLSRAKGTRIISRMKSADSMTKKILSDGFEVNHYSALVLESDAIGIRIIASSLENVYNIKTNINDIISKTSNARIIKTKDFIKNPKKSGYRSLHIILGIKSNDPTYKEMKVEIQIRTAMMDCWASLEHIVKYKKSIEVTPELYDILNCYKNEAEQEINNLKLA